MLEIDNSLRNHFVDELNFAVGADTSIPREFVGRKIDKIRTNGYGRVLEEFHFREASGNIEPRTLEEIRRRAIDCLRRDLASIGELETARKIIGKG